MFKNIYILSLILLLSGCAIKNDYQKLKTDSPVRYSKNQTAKTNQKLAIAFGGGGVRGFTHLGVIKALEENHIKADIVTGSSAGSIAAVLYASGMPYSEIKKE